jgi:hypothetical protein
MAELFANDAYTTLNGAINNSVTTIVVADGALFPAEGDFRIRVDDEFMLVTGVSGTTWTVERAVEGMGVQATGTAASHADDAEIRQVLTRDGLGSLGGGGSGILIPELLLPEDDDFPETVMDPKWTRVKHTTVTKGNWGVGSGFLSWQQIAAGGNEMDVWVQPSTIAVGDYVQCAFKFVPSNTWMAASVGFSDSSTWNGGTQVMDWVHYSGNNYRHMLNTYVGFQNRAQDGTFVDFGPVGTPFHMRVKYESANTWGLYVSPNGRHWYTVQTNYSRTMTPTHVFVGAALLNPTYPSGNILDIFYFRKNAVTP